MTHGKELCSTGVHIVPITDPMGGSSRHTRAAKGFRVVVVLGSVVLSVSVFLPWCRINGFTYTFLTVDSWKALPIAEMVIAAGGALAAVIFLAQIKRIGLFVGGTGFALNLVGSDVAARLANVHNPDPYFRIWAVLTVSPAWGGWIALLTSGILIVGALSRWSARVGTHGSPSTGIGESFYSKGSAEDEVHGIPKQLRADDGSEGSHFLQLDQVLAPAKPPNG